MTTATETIGPQSTMREVLEVYPGAQRALFRRYHIGGCASCGFQPAETLEQVCGRNNSLNVEEVLEQIKTSHEQDAKILIGAKELAEILERDKSVKLLDVRSREEYDTVRIAGSILMSQPAMQEILGQWRRNEVFVIIDHVGKQGLDAAAYFLGHGFENVRCLRGGIDAWSQEIDPKLARYRLG
jgi:rhodanese-related sulfurtransferase